MSAKNEKRGEEQCAEYSDFLEPASAAYASVCGSSASVCRSAEYSDSFMADEQDLFAAEPASAQYDSVCGSSASLCRSADSFMADEQDLFASVCGSSASVCRSAGSFMADEQDLFAAGKKGLVGLH